MKPDAVTSTDDTDSGPEMRIAEVAELTGMTASAIRYYEQVGVLPPPPRADNGYRRYDQRTVDRLRFIVRAKQLGCTLEEIADLSLAWEGGRCRPIQDHLRALVADKISAVQIEAAQLNVLADDLRAAANGLDRHRPGGGCDDRCGCISDPSISTTTGSTPAPVPLTDKGGATRVPVDCSLDADEARTRLRAWDSLLEGRAGGVVERRPLPNNGMRLVFGAGVDPAALARLAAAEQDCCNSLAFSITIDQRGIGLDITTPDGTPDALGDLFGGSR